MKLIFLGPPGSGKGTQGAHVCQAYGLAHISTGDLLRAEIKNGTDLGKLAKRYIEKGELVPDDVIISMVEKHLAGDDCKNGFLLDGFPRTESQAMALEEKIDIDMVISIAVPDDALIARLSGRRVCAECGNGTHVDYMNEDGKCEKCGGEYIQRDDDNAETVANRLEVYYKTTMPLIEYYEERKLLRDIDGNRPIDDVDRDIRAVLDSLND